MSSSSSVFGWLRDWWLGRSEAEQLRSMSEDDLRRVSADVGMWSGDLTALSERGPHAADLLGSRLAGMGLDVERLSDAFPGVMQDMQRVCAFCESKGRCEHDLEHGGRGLPGYCPNAESMQDLVRSTGAGKGGFL